MMEDCHEEMAEKLYQTYSTVGSLDPDSLMSIIDSSNTTYGGISSSDCADNVPGVYSSSAISLALFGSNSLRSLVENCSEMDTKPTMFLTTQALEGVYASKLQPSERRTPENGKSGATDLSFMGIPIVADPLCRSSHWLAINTDDLKFIVSDKYNFAFGAHENDPDRMNAVRVSLSWAGAMTAAVRRSYGGYSSMS